MREASGEAGSALVTLRSLNCSEQHFGHVLSAERTVSRSSVSDVSCDPAAERARAPSARAGSCPTDPIRLPLARRGGPCEKCACSLVSSHAVPQASQRRSISRVRPNLAITVPAKARSAVPPDVHQVTADSFEQSLPSAVRPRPARPLERGGRVGCPARAPNPVRRSYGRLGDLDPPRCRLARASEAIRGHLEPTDLDGSEFS